MTKRQIKAKNNQLRKVSKYMKLETLEELSLIPKALLYQWKLGKIDMEDEPLQLLDGAIDTLRWEHIASVLNR